MKQNRIQRDLQVLFEATLATTPDVVASGLQRVFVASSASKFSDRNASSEHARHNGSTTYFLVC